MNKRIDWIGVTMSLFIASAMYALTWWIAPESDYLWGFITGWLIGMIASCTRSDTDG